MDPKRRNSSENGYRVTVGAVAASLVCLFGAWLIRRGFRLDRNGGAAIIVVVHGDDAWSTSAHLGLSGQARKAAKLASETAMAFDQHADALDEIGEMTDCG